MAIQIIKDSFPVKQFNNLAIHPLQAWEWGEARKKTGVEVLQFGEFKNNKLINVFQITIHSLVPNLYCLTTHYKIGYLPRSKFPSRYVLEFLYDYGKKNKIIFIKIEPYVEKRNYKLPTTNYQLEKSSHPLFPEWTQIFDLTKSEEELLKNMHHKTRYNIRLAQKKGVVVKEMSNEKGFEIFSKLYFETCKRQQYYGHTPKYHKIVWESLKNNIAHILIAFYNNTPTAAYELFYFKDILYYPYGGTSLEYRNVMAPNLLMWEAIRLGKKLGAKKFDMWGSSPPQYDQSHSWSGFTRFKEGYGGKFVQFVGSYDLVINPFIYKVYNFVYKLRELYLQLKKRI
ncbi:peptidoglycan bridge formation glycyltransferase FemA/FemB family protein [Candidatus Roizmanbacteria bacterium]|nr:peptidoglycan bridge formation glycyltransferase FemA/FemB family protein [Candidatus Roizmanbacteria bacterium]